MVSSPLAAATGIAQSASPWHGPSGSRIVNLSYSTPNISMPSLLSRNVSQFHASSPKNAAMKLSAHLVEIKGMSAPAIRKRLADRLSSEVPIAIEGIRRVWCCSASVGKRCH